MLEVRRAARAVKAGGESPMSDDNLAVARAMDAESVCVEDVRGDEDEVEITFADDAGTAVVLSADDLDELPDEFLEAYERYAQAGIDLDAEARAERRWL